MCMLAVVTEPETALLGMALLGCFEPLQHLLKWLCFLQLRQTASLAGQEALLVACVVPWFLQACKGCVLLAVAAALSGG